MTVELTPFCQVSKYCKDKKDNFSHTIGEVKAEGGKDHKGSALKLQYAFMSLLRLGLSLG